MELRCACRSKNISETSRFELSIGYILRLKAISSTENGQCGVLPSFGPSKQARDSAMLHCQRNLSPITLTLCAGFLLTAGTASALAADPTGDWRVADGVANIRVAQCNGGMWGVVSWEKDAGGHDVHNPDASKRNRPTLGMPILLNMKKQAGADSWEGQVYNAKDGRTYSSSITLTDPDHLEIRGCVLGFLCGGETWTRVGPPIPSSTAHNTAKGSPRTTGAATTGAAGKATKAQGQAAADGIGDICLLPDLARFSH
jgi:uncharacterized protein (DUF2147 family)